MGGAWLIALWAVGLVLIVFAVLLGADALLRERKSDAEPEMKTRHDEIMDQWRKAR